MNKRLERKITYIGNQHIACGRYLKDFSEPCMASVTHHIQDFSGKTLVGFRYTCEDHQNTENYPIRN